MENHRSNGRGKDSDEMDPACGRGWAALEKDGKLSGRIFIHDGDSSAFTAELSR